MLSVWAEERILTFVAINTLGVVLAVLADTTSFVVTVDIQREVFLVDVFGVDTLSRMTVTVAWFALERSSIRVLVPLLLFEPWTTLSTLNSTSVVLALACQNTFCRAWVQHITSVCMAVTHAAATDRDILNRVEVSSSNGGILSGDGHQMSQKILRTQ